MRCVIVLAFCCAAALSASIPPKKDQIDHHSDHQSQVTKIADAKSSQPSHVGHAVADHHKDAGTADQRQHTGAELDHIWHGKESQPENHSDIELHHPENGEEGASEHHADSVKSSGSDSAKLSEDVTGKSQQDICTMDEAQGNCFASIPRWRFDPKKGICVQFIYGGCGGNANNFETREECNAKCSI